jgi:ABC-type antimicrobial peptide transport system permease subunit
VFLPYLQTGGQLFLQARTAAAPALSLSAVRDALVSLDNSVLIQVHTTEEATALELTLRAAATWLLSGLGSLGLLLAAIGLFGVLAWEVARRTPEIGIRMALGAPRSAVRNEIVRDALGLVAVGTVVGLGLMFLATYPLRGFLAGVHPIDPFTIAAVAAILSIVAVLASWVPAHRASSIDPSRALRRE